MKRQLRHNAGFTLVELLVTLAIIGVLIALLLPAVQSARASARRTQCQNRLRQLGLALHNYHDSHLVFPSGSYILGSGLPIQSGWGWGAMILPNLEQNPLYQQIDFNIGTAVGSNLSVMATPLSIWQCPSEVSPNRLHINSPDHPAYDMASGNYCGSSTVLDDMSSVKMGDISDGASQTLLAGERIVHPGVNGGLVFTSAWFGQVAFADEYEHRSIPYLAPSHLHPINDPTGDPRSFGSRHTGGAFFVFCDGSSRFLSENMDGLVFEALGTPSGGEAVSVP